MDGKKQKYFYIGLYMATYISFSFGMMQFIPFLSKIGYNSMERGILLSSFAVMTIILQMVFGFLSDKFRTVKKFMILALLIYGAVTYMFYTRQSQLFPYHLVAIALSGGLINTSCGLSDTWILSSNEYLRKRLSFIKTFGSIGWALGSVILPTVLFKFGYNGVGKSILLLSVFSLIFMYFIKDVDKNPKNKLGKIGMHDIIELLLNKKYTLLVVILFF